MRPTVPVRLLLALVAVLLVVAACGGGDDRPLVVYERAWPDGMVEETTVHGDGRVLMRHGEFLERFTIPEASVATLRTALQAPIPTGSPEESPQRTLTLADGTRVEAVRPEPGNAVELLDRLTDTHAL
jgi:hypothetical protein